MVRFHFTLIPDSVHLLKELVGVFGLCIVHKGEIEGHWTMQYVRFGHDCMSCACYYVIYQSGKGFP